VIVLCANQLSAVSHQKPASEFFICLYLTLTYFLKLCGPTSAA
jgi:hypothetical protein